MLVMMWLNAVRNLSAFDAADKFGVVLLLKLAASCGGLFSALLQTACFAASHSGSLDRVFSDSRLQTSDITRYRRLAVIHTVVCWIVMLVHVPLFILPLIIMENELNMTLLPFGVHIFVSGYLLIVVKTVMSVLFLLTSFVWYFSHSVNYIEYYIHPSAKI